MKGKNKSKLYKISQRKINYHFSNDREKQRKKSSQKEERFKF